MWCNGAETCNGINICQSGIVQDCDDSVGCTDDFCNETADSCDNTPDNSTCDDANECTQNICNAVSGCQYPDEPQGSWCGSARDCQDDACNGFIAEFFPDDGHDSCDGAGNCGVYSCVIEDFYCSDNNAGDGVNSLTCGAQCDQNNDCNVDEICNLASCGCEPVSICIDDDKDRYNVTGGECGLIDCNDTDDNVYPGADEICNDNIDNNCNNVIDEFGCIMSCSIIGQEQLISNGMYYCGIDNIARPQKPDNQQCYNNFECQNNYCSFNVCVNIVPTIKQIDAVLDQILDLIT